jgi:hypothetical protein
MPRTKTGSRTAKGGGTVDAITCTHGVRLHVIEEGASHARCAILCTGLTSNIAPGSTTAALAAALADAGWRSIRFDYCGSLDPETPAELRTMDRMRGDIESVLTTLPAACASVLVARGRAAQPALRAAAGDRRVTRVLLWAPIIWVDAPHSTLKATIMADVERDGYTMIDGTRVGRAFLAALDDPSDDEVRGWARKGCVYSIVQPSGDEIHALHLSQRLADLLRSGGASVHMTHVPGTHPTIARVPRDQIDAVVNDLG